MLSCLAGQHADFAFSVFRSATRNLFYLHVTCLVLLPQHVLVFNFVNGFVIKFLFWCHSFSIPPSIANCTSLVNVTMLSSPLSREFPKGS